MALLQKSKAPQAILKSRGGWDPQRISQGSHDNTLLSPGKQRQAAVGKVTGARWKARKRVKRIRPRGSLPSSGTGAHGQDHGKKEGRRKNLAYSKNSWWSRNTHIQVCSRSGLVLGQEQGAAMALPSSSYMRDLCPPQPAHGTFPMPTLVALIS